MKIGSQLIKIYLVELEDGDAERSYTEVIGVASSRREANRLMKATKWKEWSLTCRPVILNALIMET